MLRLTSQIDTIRALRAQNTRSSLTYAALECRLAIEMVCHQLLRISYGFLSQTDLRSWQPARVLETLIDEIDPDIVERKIVWTSPASTFDHAGDSGGSSERADAEPATRFGIDPRYLNECWRDLTGFLHIEAPELSSGAFDYHSPENTIRPKIDEILRELERIDSGTLIATGPEQELSFACECGALNSRRVRFLRAGRSVSCSNAACSETWRVEENEGAFEFIPLTFAMRCRNPLCGETILLHQRPILEMNNRTTGRAKCRHCGSDSLFQWRLNQIEVVDHTAL